MEQRQIIAGLAPEEFHKDELIGRATALDIDPLMELIIEEPEKDGTVASAEGLVESAMAVSRSLLPESELDKPVIGDEATTSG